MKLLIGALVLYAATALPLHAQETPQDLQNGFMAAVMASDADALAGLYAEDAVLYPVGKQAARGRAEIHAVWAPFLADNTIHDVKINEEGNSAGEDTHVAWGLWSVTFTPKDEEGAEKMTLEGRFMDMAKKKDGKWQYVVDHASVPFEEPE